MHHDERAIDDGDTADIGLPETGDDDDELVHACGDPTEDVDEEFGDAEVDSQCEQEVAAPAPESLMLPEGVPTVFHNFMDALYPARPPVAKNARIVRRFDLEAAKYDPRPAVAPPPAAMPAPAPVVDEKKKDEPLSREELRALRNRSLRAAAGLD